MLFVGLALLVSLGLAILVSADVGSFIGLSEAQTGQAIPGLVMLIALGASLFARRLPLRHILNGALIWVVIFGLSVSAYTYRSELSGIASRVMGEIRPGFGVIADNGNSVSFQRGLGQSFYLQTRVNETKIRMIFDTGASVVVLTYENALHAGIDVARLRFNVDVQTANGVGQAAGIVLPRLQIGDIVRENVRAMVTERGALETSLLGMSFLETLSRYSVSQETLELVN